MLDYDLAKLYGVKTKVLNQAVKRNISRFPADFMFQLNKNEVDKVVTICDHLKDLKYSYQLPYAFTEQGVAMLSSVLRSERAIQVNIAVMRAFVKLKKYLNTHKEFARKLKFFEKIIKKHDVEIEVIFEAMKKMMEPPSEPDKQIGFLSDRD